VNFTTSIQIRKTPRRLQISIVIT